MTTRPAGTGRRCRDRPVTRGPKTAGRTGRHLTHGHTAVAEEDAADG